MLRLRDLANRWVGSLPGPGSSLDLKDTELWKQKAWRAHSWTSARGQQRGAGELSAGHPWENRQEEPRAPLRPKQVWASYAEAALPGRNPPCWEPGKAGTPWPERTGQTPPRQPSSGATDSASAGGGPGRRAPASRAGPRGGWRGRCAASPAREQTGLGPGPQELARAAPLMSASGFRSRGPPERRSLPRAP